MSNVYTFEPKNASPETLREALIANTKAEYTKNQELHTKVAVIVERVKGELTPEVCSKKRVLKERKIRINISEQEWAELSEYMGGTKMRPWQGGNMELKRYEGNIPCLRIEVLEYLDDMERIMGSDPLDELVYHFHSVMRDAQYEMNSKESYARFRDSKSLMGKVALDVQQALKKISRK